MAMSDYQFQSSSDNSGENFASQIIEANNLEKSGQIEDAIAIYREIIKLDREGTYKGIAQKSLENLEQTKSAKTEQIATTKQQSTKPFWQRLNLKTKTTLLLIAISSVATISVGSIAYYFANISISQEIIEAKRKTASEVANKVAFYMRERYGDIQIMAGLTILTNPELRAQTTVQDKQLALDQFVKAYTIYNSVAAFDLEGNPIAQSTGEALGNHKDRSYFQEALKIDGPVLSQPILSKSSGIIAVYLASPIKDAVSGQTIGVIRARMPVNYLRDVILSVSEEDNFLLDNQGQIFAASELQEYEQIQSSPSKTLAANSRFNSYQQLTQSQSSNTVVTNNQLVSYIPFQDFEDEFRAQLPNLGWSTITTLDKDIAFAPQRQLIITFVLGTLVVSILVAIIAVYIANRATRPIVSAAEAVDKLGQGELDTRLSVIGEDELAVLGSNINLMAEQIQNLLEQQTAETRKQKQEKERLQKEVVNLLLDIENAQKGDLTVTAKMTDGAVGSIADAFNATIRKLRELVLQVQNVSNEVNELSQKGESSVSQLSTAAVTQADEIDETLSNIAQINESIENVANFAQEAAQIARQGLLQAEEGDTVMDRTVNSIEKIRVTVADTTKKVKQLAESSQEIAQIVDIISGISEKTNLLAFNASVEAARAGENGQGFRIVADEVRRLADRVTEATKDIQQLVGTIQQDTSSVLQAMEISTTDVVTGSELVRQTKQTLQGLAVTSKQIDEYLQSISTNTTEQTNASQQVNQKIAGVATIAQTTSTEAKDVVKSLRTLVEEAETLKSSVAQFRI